MPLKRKVIQMAVSISAIPPADGMGRAGMGQTLLALCSDGTMWKLGQSSLGTDKWTPIGEVPDDECVIVASDPFHDPLPF